MTGRQADLIGQTAFGPTIGRVGTLPLAALVFFTAILLLNRIVFHLFASPLPDEAYYWLWGQHPALSYYDHPGLQAWLQSLSTYLFGINRFSLRVPTLLTTGVFIWSIFWWLAKFRIATGFAQKWLVLLIVFSSPIIFIFTEMAFIDHLLIALISLAAIAVYLTLEALTETGRIALFPLYSAAVLSGLAGLTKYNAILFAAGVFMALIAVKRFRPLLRSGHLYAAVMLGLLCISPVLIWNLDHADASFRYHLQDRLSTAWSVTAGLRNLVGFVITAAVAVSPIIFGAIIALLRKSPVWPPRLAIWRAMSKSILLVSFVFFFALSFYTNVLYYWNIVAYVVFIPLALLYMRKRWQIYAHLIYGAVFASIFTFNYVIFPIPAIFGRYDPESAVMFGWPKISAQAVTLKRDLGAKFLVTSDYRTGAILAFWSGDKNVDVVSHRRSQFDFWHDLSGRKGQDAIILTDRAFPMTALMASEFASVKRIKTTEIRKFGQPINRYVFYLGRGFGKRHGNP